MPQLLLLMPWCADCWFSFGVLDLSPNYQLLVCPWWHAVAHPDDTKYLAGIDLPEWIQDIIYMQLRFSTTKSTQILNRWTFQQERSGPSYYVFLPVCKMQKIEFVGWDWFTKSPFFDNSTLSGRFGQHPGWDDKSTHNTKVKAATGGAQKVCLWASSICWGDEHICLE